MQPVWDWFRWLNQATGINLSILYDAFDRARFARGFVMTLALSAICIVLSVVIGGAGPDFITDDVLPRSTDRSHRSVDHADGAAE